MSRQHYLYIDTLNHLIVGILSKQSMEFLELAERKETKSSGIIHRVIYDILKQHNEEPMGLAGVIQASGPGSYTGMRLSHGIVQIFKWQGVKCYGFYHYEVPYWMGIKEGVWRAKAFKKEVFCYRWKGDENNTYLVPEQQINWLKKDFFSHDSTHGMIKSRTSEFFSYIINHHIIREPYYFRPPEREFKRPES